MNKLELKKYYFDYLITKLEAQGFDNVWYGHCNIMSKTDVQQILCVLCFVSNELEQFTIPSLFSIFDNWYSLYSHGLVESDIISYINNNESRFSRNNVKSIELTHPDYDVNIISIDRSLELLTKKIPRIKKMERYGLTLTIYGTKSWIDAHARAIKENVLAKEADINLLLAERL